MKAFYVEDAPRLGAGSEFISFFSVLQRQMKRKKSGELYLALLLADRTGQLEARMWDNVDAVPAFEPGSYVKVQACLDAYNNKLQVIVKKLRVARPEEISADDFLPPEAYLPQTARDVDELWAEVEGKVAGIGNAHLRALLRSFLDDAEIAARLRRAPAARSLHHARIGGLLEHKAELLDVCDRTVQVFQGRYGGLRVDRDLLLTGALLHDIGKIYELSWDTAFEYTIEGQLLGHISIGLRMVREKLALLPDFPPRLALMVEHMLLSHHGHYEFGSPKLPMTAEAMMLHMLDDLCAKMELFRGELLEHAKTGEGGKPTGYIRALERPILDSAAFLAGASVLQPVAPPPVPSSVEASPALPASSSESAALHNPAQTNAALPHAASHAMPDPLAPAGDRSDIQAEEHSLQDDEDLAAEFEAAEEFEPPREFAAYNAVEAHRAVAATLSAMGLPGMVRASSIVVQEIALGDPETEEAAAHGLPVED